ncbi:hypothetical protein VTN00DRAFT_6697 [Thermoascus crustaceus]|uniref:uncharacterized protein n=1 Tax=Thermoascus crustaceus TaxID=5088 RepID=UPI003743B106
MEHDNQKQTPLAEPPGQSTWKAENIPRAFLAVATHRERVNGKRVVAGDKRMQLHRDLDNLALSVQTLQNDFQPLLLQLSDHLSRDASAHLEQFKVYLGKFLETKMAYEELDDDLAGAEYLLSEDERTVYNRLATVNSPLPSTFNKSMSSFSLPIPRFSGEGPVDDFSSVSSNSFELIYGYGTTVGERPFQKPAIPGPFLRHARQATDLLPIVPDSMAHLDHLSSVPRSTEGKEPFSPRSTLEVIANDFPPEQLAGRIEEKHESLKAGNITATAKKPIVSYSQSDLERFPPLFLSDRSEALLDYLVREFSSTNDRINRWLLHMLRSSFWEIRRFYLYFLREAERKRSHVQDETTWSCLVLELWSKDIQPQSGSAHAALVTASLTNSAEIKAKIPINIRPVRENWHESVPGRNLDLETHNANLMEAYAVVVKQKEQYEGLSIESEQSESIVRETGTRFPENPLEDPGVPNGNELEELKDIAPSKPKVTTSSISKVDAITQTEKIAESREVHEPKGISGLEEKLDNGEGPDNRQGPDRNTWTRGWLHLKEVCSRYSRLSLRQFKLS